MSNREEVIGEILRQFADINEHTYDSEERRRLIVQCFEVLTRIGGIN